MNPPPSDPFLLPTAYRDPAPCPKCQHAWKECEEQRQLAHDLKRENAELRASQKTVRVWLRFPDDAFGVIQALAWVCTGAALGVTCGALIFHGHQSPVFQRALGVLALLLPCHRSICSVVVPATESAITQARNGY